MRRAELEAALRLLVVTDPGLAAPRTVLEVVEGALAGGARAVQLRDKGDSPRELVRRGRALRDATRRHGALLLVNDRLDVALAVGADGVHLGPEDLPVAAVRRVAPAGFLIGRSADRVDVARRAVQEGADYIGCGTVYATTTKPDAGDVIGPEGLAAVVGGVAAPVVAIGGITVAGTPAVAAAGAAGVAVVSALMRAADPEAEARAFLRAFAEAVPSAPRSG